ncbi:hypothetical protein L226DRAFT_534947 [Lentinus tigrinus ALCF2SS1-7]|uniref:MYND-type domain-containing protein n=1 Tax=Lentinus tigrinus ALCF2SS1-6 TaxID=1328759 RepID=A0A5C2S9Q7_9APHY|nr:hypothetical protein L227DRAFT_600989 [Lentinus tigrinus ALCF2SS1-6]RPD74731.1 hypothetical protein L226DRAFT_534947 [Lentinus tigrinus ALCF2SS1-7]
MASEGSWGHLHWTSPEFRRTADTFFTMTKNRNPQGKKHKSRAAHQCTFCGKEDQANLRACSLCKCARYCSKQCQVADYKARHKRECVDFVYPPLTRAFMTEPVNDERYPQRPVFARGHCQGVGCWVSVDGQFDCILKSLAEPIDMNTTDYHRVMERRMALAQGNEVVRLGERYNALTRNLLSLSILVQNRRKDSMNVVVFGARVQLVTLASMKDAFLKGRSEMDQFHTFKVGSESLGVLSVADDPWEKLPRLQIKNFNGTDIIDNTPPPPPSSVIDASKGIVSLSPGEYVIYKLQFRVGDNHRIVTDFEALSRLAGVSIAFAPQEQGSNPVLLDYILSQQIHADGYEPQGIVAAIDRPALYDHYADYIESGEEAYIESHFGKERVEALRKQSLKLESMGMRTIQTLERNGEMERLTARLRAAGLEETLQMFERLRARAA